ncbi:hypothetical protein SmJEL517_g01808 [Synchytrium microbalum]|uniref:Uncharacterized protein n=1 Tax=Synchytrium microbalum TaxID=1806994 RepID=A0A507CEE8_9FUNG|nr:uncharacterized protein SmJEL517_g01808 [Synchytrium microbalum]TPX35883.1 hypothetical protein SmJEL517_g01808 [Synchytrium microbalum]
MVASTAAQHEELMPPPLRTRRSSTQLIQGVMQSAPGTRSRLPSDVPPLNNSIIIFDEDDEIHMDSSNNRLNIDANSTSQELRKHASSISHPAAVLGVFEKWALLQNQGLAASRKNSSDEHGNGQHVATEYDELCMEVLTALGELEASMEEVMRWKDGFISNQGVPSVVKLKLVIMFTRLFRSKSDLHEPLFELIKQVKVYSQPWQERREALLAIEHDFENQKHLVDVAIRRVEHLESQIARMKSERRIAMWERLTLRMLEKESMKRQQLAANSKFNAALSYPENVEEDDARPATRPITPSIRFDGELTPRKSVVIKDSVTFESPRPSSPTRESTLKEEMNARSLESIASSKSNLERQSEETQTDSELPESNLVLSESSKPPSAPVTVTPAKISSSDFFISDEPSWKAPKFTHDALAEFEKTLHTQHPNIEKQLAELRDLNGRGAVKSIKADLPPVVLVKRGIKPESPLIRGWTVTDTADFNRTNLQSALTGDMPSWLSFDGDVHVGRHVGQSKDTISLSARESETSNGNANGLAFTANVVELTSPSPPRQNSNPPLPAQYRQVQDANEAKMKAMDDNYSSRIAELSAKILATADKPMSLLCPLPMNGGALSTIASKASSLGSLSSSPSTSLSQISPNPTKVASVASNRPEQPVRPYAPIRAASIAAVPSHQQSSQNVAQQIQPRMSIATARSSSTRNSETGSEASVVAQKSMHAEFMPHPGAVKASVPIEAVMRHVVESVRILPQAESRHYASPQSQSRQPSTTSTTHPSTINLFDSARKRSTMR